MSTGGVLESGTDGVLVRPSERLAREFTCLERRFSRHVIAPPLRPERFERIEALVAIHVLELTVAELLVALCVDKGVACSSQRLGTAAITLDDRRLDTVKAQLGEGIPCTGFVGCTGDSLAPVFGAKDLRTAGCLADEAGVAVLTNAV